jgi:hypothetical protein
MTAARTAEVAKCNVSSSDGASEERIRQANGTAGNTGVLPHIVAACERRLSDHRGRVASAAPTRHERGIRTLDAVRTRLENARFLRFFEQYTQSAVSISAK